MSSNNCVRCYICFKKLEFNQPSIRAQITTYTKTPIKTFLERLSDQQLTETDDEIVICSECQSKLNEYDLACLTAKNIETDLRDLLKKSKELLIKPEVVLIIKQEREPEDDGDQIENNASNDEECFSSDEEKPLIQIKSEKKLKVCAPLKRDNKSQKLKKTDDNVIRTATIPKQRGRPRTSNKIVIRNRKSLIPDSVVPKDLKCTICALQVTTVTSYKRHLQTHYKTKEREFRCTTCRARYKNQIELDAHVEKHKTIGINNPLQCVECLKVFTSRNNLNHHLAIHTGEKLYICESCGKGFVHHTSFREHKDCHVKIKSIECPTCGRLFNQKTHLNRHIRTHTGEKPYECSVCFRKFANKYNINSHMKVHQQKLESDADLLHVCVVCNRSFSQAILLKGHMKRTHQLADAEDELFSTSEAPY